MYKIHLAFFAFLFSLALAQAQVTIGSNEQPSKGSLLDLKEWEDTESKQGKANSNRGLLLPRVVLKSLNELAPIPIDENNNQVGIMVYNTKSEDDLCERMPPGVYVWNGESWQGFATTDGTAQRPTQIISTQRMGLEQPNTYMIHKASIVRISIDKARKAWDGNSWRDWGASPPRALLPTRIFSNNLSAELIWQDSECGPIREVKLSADKNFIEVWANGDYGNAVVGLKDNGTIVWSWHIWSTPEISLINYGGNVWMDRNLGAVSATPGDSGTKGNHYQWGRKDPFANATEWNITEPLLYMIDGTLTSIEIGNTLGLEAAVTNPKMFPIVKGNAYDWYTTNNGKWADRWGASGHKAPADPCPEGWRVPNGTGGRSPNWQHTSGPWGNLTRPAARKWNSGWIFDGPGKMAGYYPAAGQRNATNGLLNLVDNYGYYWSAATGRAFGTGGSANRARYMQLQKTRVSVWTIEMRGSGESVRCVKE